MKEKMSCFNCCEDDDMHKSYDNEPFMANNATGNNAGYRATKVAPKDVQAIVVSLFLNRIGSYGRVYHGVLRNGHAAVKKLDSSKQPDQEFLAQVRLMVTANI